MQTTPPPRGQEYAQQAPAMLVEERAAFIALTYGHLFAAILGFTLLEIFFFTTGLAETIAQAFLSVSWLVVLGGFVLVSWIASRVAAQAEAKATQYMALAGFVVAEALIFVPLLFIANYYAPGAIQSAATVTLIGFTALTAIAFVTRADFSFLRGLLIWAGAIAMLAIVGGVLFGAQLGTWFSVGMVGLAGAAILYDTSNIIHRYPSDRYVSASLQLFASVALMFWYVLQLFLSRD